jgi:outer membrane protein assembly factor BamB
MIQPFCAFPSSIRVPSHRRSRKSANSRQDNQSKVNEALLASKYATLFVAAMAAAHLPAGAVAADYSVLTYHAHENRSGNFVVPKLTWDRAQTIHLDEGFQTHVSGKIYAQPLYWHPPGTQIAILLVATEDNIVYALDAESGREIWSRSLGTSIPRSALECGDIDPLGTTGTPVIDESTQTVYLEAGIYDSSGPHRRVFALALKDGSPLPGWPVDIADALRGRDPTFNPKYQNERGALTILNGTLYVPFGGHYGDCGQYNGWVVGISLRDPNTTKSWNTRARGGGVWAPAGISSDGTSLFIATGNTIGAATWSGGEAVIRLAGDLHDSAAPKDFFAPANWHDLDEEDADLGGTAPIPLDVATKSGPQALVLALGKDGRAYLLDRSNLGGIGGSLTVEMVSNDPIRTAPAAYPATDGVFVAFQGRGIDCPRTQSTSAQSSVIRFLQNIKWQRVGRLVGKWLKDEEDELTALKIRPGSPPTVATSWCGRLRGAGSPIVTTTNGHSDPVVWIVGAEGDNQLHGFRGDTGDPLFNGSADIMHGLHHFQSLIASEDRLYVSADGQVYAFVF